MVSQTISHYRIIRKLGAGGMGEVYLAEDLKLGRRVAIKLLPPQSVADEQARRRLMREAKAAAHLDHPNICAIHEVGEQDGLNFIVMQYVEGETLTSRIGRGPLKLGEALDLAAQVADALSEAHSHNIIHRDIKPENILITARGRAVVMDFGLAKVLANRDSVQTDAETQSLLSSPGAIAGTVPYMSPEQVKGEMLDARTDIFSFGVVLYEMLTGHHPFTEGSSASTISAILTKEPQPLARYAREAPAELERIVTKALSKDREARYQTAKDLLIDLKSLKHHLEFEAEFERSKPPERRGVTGVVAGETASAEEARARAARSETGVEARATSRTGQIINQVKRHKRAAIVTLVALALAAVATLFWYSNRTRAAPLTEKDTILLADFENTTGDAVFDGTLKQALAIQLEQSPFLNIFPEERVRQTLRLMARSPDERVTKDVAREICERQGLKAYLAGSISSLGSHLVVTLEAVNVQTGETLARQQVEAEGKERVLGALGAAATSLREKLGESLASIQKYDAPIEQATTSSLEALKVYSLGREQHYKGNYSEAIPLIKHATELDPNFARAYAGLSYAYANLGQQQLTREAMQKAFELRERTSEFEKLKITADYYWYVEHDAEKSIEALEVVTRTYPRDHTAHGNLAGRYRDVGRYEQAVEEGREAMRLNPNYSPVYISLALAFLRLNRFDEAKAILEQALAQKLDTPEYHTYLYEIALVRGDTAGMQQQLDWANGKPEGYNALFWQAETAEFQGQLRRARDLNQRGADAELSRNLKENAGVDFSLNALVAASVGNCQQAREDAARASALPRTDFSLSRTAIALALCGEAGQAQSLVDEYTKQFPKDTIVNAVWLPVIRAAVEIHRNNPAQAIQLLQSADRYDRVGNSWPQYLRGQAYLAQGAAAEAAAEFQKILDRRGLAPTSVLYPLAHLGLARAAALQGDAAKARKSYEDFFALWKDADPDIPILIEAKKEYEKLK